MDIVKPGLSGLGQTVSVLCLGVGRRALSSLAAGGGLCCLEAMGGLPVPSSFTDTSGITPAPLIWVRGGFTSSDCDA